MNTVRHHLSDEEKQVLSRQIAASLENEQPDVLIAYIFGSFVSTKPFADVDIAFYCRSTRDNVLDVELETENRIEQLVHLPVDVRIINAAPLSFQYHVIRDGVVILDRDPNLRAEYEGQVLKQYFDFSRFRKRYLKEVVHAPL